MNKINTIEWHEECLDNQKCYLEGLQKELERLETKVDRLEKETSFYEYQIVDAKRIEKDKFDPKKFRVLRGQA